MQRKRKFLFLFLIIFIYTHVKSQEINGQIDDLSEMTTQVEIPFTMKDGTHLMTDIYLPVTRDSMVVEFEMPGFGMVSLEVLQKGIQYIIYDSLNGHPNPHPYQLPLVFTRTPYNKFSDNAFAALFSILGYAYALQDMRGRYSSEGVYLPMYSDAWDKTPYHPGFSHILDITDLNSPMNGNKHEDGYESILFINDSLYRIYKSDTFLLCNGNIGMIGASALGNTQYQAASAHKINPLDPGLKCLMPIVATNENYHSTGFHNGIYRQSLVNGWLYGQIEDLNEEMIESDTSLSNNIHTPADYGMSSNEEVYESALSHFTTHSYNGLPPSYFPNSTMRTDLDASQAPVNQFGEGDSLGNYSRYSNLEVPIFHLSGWWDIFTNGQVDTYNFLMDNLSNTYNNKRLQKLVIGPWAHQTVGRRTTGDITYPQVVSNFIIDMENMVGENGEISMGTLLNSDIVQWFRYNLNYNDFAQTGNPKFILPESNNWQALNDQLSLRFPSSDYIIGFDKFLNYLAGNSSLSNIPMEYMVGDSVFTDVLNIPAPTEPLIQSSEAFNLNEITDFLNTPNVRLYIPGPVDDSISENELIGNYWLMQDSFPFYNNITNTSLYLHANGIINKVKPINDEGSQSYISDPNDPVLTVGGSNMIVNNPDGHGRSQGQINLANPEYAPFTMEREGVISFESAEIEDSLSVIGIPVATLYAECSPTDSSEKLTDTDFFVRILDVYPDGREYFVFEGAVNARARNYAKKLAEGTDNPEIPFENIRINTVYEYTFKMQPIGYTFGKQHKIKVLISSSNYPRYQVNANVPIMENEFFLRQPNDGQTYNFNGVEMPPRTVLQKIMISKNYPSHIELPVYGTNNLPDLTPMVQNSKVDFFTVYPNPASDYVICMHKNSRPFKYELIDITGKIIKTGNHSNVYNIEISNLSNGIYFIRFLEPNSQYLQSKKLLICR